jgi:tetratricopeptide (TPR) repeat protein
VGTHHSPVLAGPPIAADPLAWRVGAGLREQPLDRAAFEKAVDRLVDEIAHARSQPARLLAMLQEATPLLRIAGRLDEARKTASAAIALGELLEDPVAAFGSQLALATVMQGDGRFDISTPLYDQLIAQARSSPALADSLHDVLFHAGRNLFDQRRFAEAARCFRESQALRRDSRMNDLLEMSAEALRQTEASTREGSR